MDVLTLRDARKDVLAREWLERVYGRYIEELAGHGADYVFVDGRPVPDLLPYWVEQEFCRPMVAHVDGDAIGFAFVGLAPFPYMRAESDACISEFHVLPRFRGRGLGRQLLRSVLELAGDGRGELSVLHRNGGALAFWRTSLSRIGIAYEEHADEDAITFTFRMKSADASASSDGAGGARSR